MGSRIGKNGVGLQQRSWHAAHFLCRALGQELFSTHLQRANPSASTRHCPSACSFLMARALLRVWQSTGVSWTSPITSSPSGPGSWIPLGQGASFHSTRALKNPCSHSSSNWPSTGPQRRIQTRSSCPTGPTSPNRAWPAFAPTVGCHPRSDPSCCWAMGSTNTHSPLPQRQSACIGASGSPATIQTHNKGVDPVQEIMM